MCIVKMKHFCGNVCGNAKINIFSVLNKNKSIISHAMYDANNQIYLSIIGYKDYLFCGIYNKSERTIHFEDTSNYFERYNALSLSKLESVFKSAWNAADHDRYFPVPEIKSAWEKAYPLLDKVIEYEQLLKKLTNQDISHIRISLEYESAIDNFVTEYENSLFSGRFINDIEYEDFEDIGER